MGRWHFGVPGDPENADRLVAQFLARLAADETPDTKGRNQADHSIRCRTTETAIHRETP